MQKFEDGGKVTLGWVGFKTTYVINRVGRAKTVMFVYMVGGWVKVRSKICLRST